MEAWKGEGFMKHTLTFALAGGDVRQAYLGGLLAADGAQVRTIGLERSGTELEAGGSPRTLFAEADVICCPCR